MLRLHLPTTTGCALRRVHTGCPTTTGKLDKHTFVHIYRQSAVLRLVPLSRQLPHGYGSSPPSSRYVSCLWRVSSCFELLFYTSATRRRPLVERQPVEELLPTTSFRVAPDSSILISTRARPNNTGKSDNISFLEESTFNTMRHYSSVTVNVSNYWQLYRSGLLFRK